MDVVLIIVVGLFLLGLMMELDRWTTYFIHKLFSKKKPKNEVSVPITRAKNQKFSNDRKKGKDVPIWIWVAVFVVGGVLLFHLFKKMKNEKGKN